MEEKFPDWPIPPGSLKIIAQKMPVPTWIFSALNHVDQETIASVKKALISLTGSRRDQKILLHSIDSGGFVQTDAKDLLLLRKLVCDEIKMPSPPGAQTVRPGVGSFGR